MDAFHRLSQLSMKEGASLIHGAEQWTLFIACRSLA